MKIHDKHMAPAELCAMIPLLPPLRKKIPERKNMKNPEGLLRTSIGSASWILTNSSDLPRFFVWVKLPEDSIGGSRFTSQKQKSDAVVRTGDFTPKTPSQKMDKSSRSGGARTKPAFCRLLRFWNVKGHGSGSSAPRLPKSTVHRVGWIVSENILVTLSLERRFRSCLRPIPTDMDKYLQFHRSWRAKTTSQLYSATSSWCFNLQFPIDIPRPLQHWNSWHNARLASHLL